MLTGYKTDKQTTYADRNADRQQTDRQGDTIYRQTCREAGRQQIDKETDI